MPFGNEYSPQSSHVLGVVAGAYNPEQMAPPPNQSIEFVFEPSPRVEPEFTFVLDTGQG